MAPSTPSESLLAWFEHSRRDLPWRRNREPWPVWVSEVMLQQTRAETVVPYFGRFLARFPSPKSVASSPVEEVLALWSGLGYYRRARSLWCATAEVERRGGIPESVEELSALPGVGPYTAAAIASICFGVVVPVVDGNVARVMARLLALADDPARAAVRRRFQSAAFELLSPQRPGDSNQALMELGATLCTPRRPACGVCPLASRCRGYASGEPERFPAPRKRRPLERVALIVAVARARGSYLLVRRGDNETLMPGLWDFPAQRGAEPEPALFASAYGGEWNLGRPLVRFRHAVTFRNFAVTAVDARWSPAGVSERSAMEWFTPAEAARLPLTGTARKLLRRLAVD